ncbi:MAG: hypothetical protein Q9181_001869 [Wetmoreana brouardii]
MASAARPRPSASSARQPPRPTTLPPYQPLTHTLNPTAQHLLHSLPTTHSLNDLKRRLQTAVTHLTDVTGDLNDQHQARKAEYDKQKARKAARARDFENSQGADGDEDGDRRMEEASRDVDDWTSKMGKGTRRVIDVQARVESVETALKELDANVSQGRTATQSTLGASQFRSQRQRHNQRRGNDDQEDEDDENNGADAQDDALIGAPAFEIFKSKVAASDSTYASLSLKDRYASHNDYIGFRKIVHDARHPDDDTPLPHSSTWFPSSSNSTAAGQNGNNQSRSDSAPADNDSDSDAEIQIAREKRSIKCPLTLLPMHDPLTSTRCPHSFEKSAILDMLNASALRADQSTQGTGRGGGGGEKALKCPVCEVLLTASTLKADPVLVRKIRRIEEQERKEREGGGSEEDEDEVDLGRPMKRRVEEVTSSPVRSREQVKRERMSQVEKGREVSLVPDSQAMDLGDGVEVEDENG